MPDFEGCIAHCNQANKDVMLDSTIQGCDALRKRAEWLCRDYCYDNYKQTRQPGARLVRTENK